MKIIVVGGSGTMGSAVITQLSQRNQVVNVSAIHGELKCDMTSEHSLRTMFKKVGEFHAVAICAGNVHFEDLQHMNSEKYFIGLNHKLMGQVNIVLVGLEYIQDNGSFTLVSGILDHDPVIGGSSASMVNGAINSFVKAAAIEMPRGIRINSISPTVLTESMTKYGPYFRGFDPVPAAKVALAYSKSIEGAQTGQVYSVL